MSVNTLSQKMMRQHLEVFPNCEWLCSHRLELADEATPQYKCPSYYDDDGKLQDCTCGGCR